MSNYGPVAGVWFDPIMPYYARADLFPIEPNLCADSRIAAARLDRFQAGRQRRRRFRGARIFGAFDGGQTKKSGRPARKPSERARAAWARNRSKHNEICATLKSWGYKTGNETRKTAPAEVWARLGNAGAANCNLLLNTAPLPDGSLDPMDCETLGEVGQRLEREGFPVHHSQMRQEKGAPAE